MEIGHRHGDRSQHLPSAGARLKGRQIDGPSAFCALRLAHFLSQLAVVIDRVAFAEVLELEHLADLDLALALVRIGTALDPLDGLGLDLTWMIQ